MGAEDEEENNPMDVFKKSKSQTKKPCRACTDFKSWREMNKKGSDLATATEHKPQSDCPLDVEQLGRNTWSFLHTMAAYYPEKATSRQQSDMSSFITLFSKFYPCEHCASDFRESLAQDQPDVSGRVPLSNWFCRQHNMVNIKLGKAEFDCSKVLERWLDGWKDGSCDV